MANENDTARDPMHILGRGINELRAEMDEIKRVLKPAKTASVTSKKSDAPQCDCFVCRALGTNE